MGHAICPFCNRQVVYGGVSFGESFLHGECFVILQEELAEEPGVESASLTLEENFDGERSEEAA
jgi:hypothetical protein